MTDTTQPQPRAPRVRLNSLARADDLLARGSVTISLMIVLAYILTLALFLLRPIEMSESTERVITVVVGTLTAAFTSVCNYWLGSSAGSARKDQLVAPAPTPGNPQQ